MIPCRHLQHPNLLPRPTLTDRPPHRPTLRILHPARHTYHVHANAPLQSNKLTVQSMVPHVEMTVNVPAHRVRAMHQHPHVRAVHDMVLPIDVQIAFPQRRDGQGNLFGATGCGVPVPRIGRVGQEGGDERLIVAFGDLPREAEDIESAAAASGSGGVIATVGVEGRGFGESGRGGDEVGEVLGGDAELVVEEVEGDGGEDDGE